MFLCVFYLCCAPVPFLVRCSRLTSNNEDLLTYLLTYYHPPSGVHANLRARVVDGRDTAELETHRRPAGQTRRRAAAANHRRRLQLQGRRRRTARRRTLPPLHRAQRQQAHNRAQDRLHRSRLSGTDGNVRTALEPEFHASSFIVASS